MIGKRVGQKVPSPLDRLLMDIPLNRIVIKVGNAGPYLFVSDFRSASEWRLEQMANVRDRDAYRTGSDVPIRHKALSPPLQVTVIFIGERHIHHSFEPAEHR